MSAILALLRRGGVLQEGDDPHLMWWAGWESTATMHRQGPRAGAFQTPHRA